MPEFQPLSASIQSEEHVLAYVAEARTHQCVLVYGTDDFLDTLQVQSQPFVHISGDIDHDVIERGLD